MVFLCILFWDGLSILNIVQNADTCSFFLHFPGSFASVDGSSFGVGDLQRVFPAITCVVSGQALTRLRCAGSFMFCQVPEAGWGDKF